MWKLKTTFPRAVREGKSRVGTQSSCITCSSLHSHFCVNLHATRRHKNCVSEVFLPTPPTSPSNSRPKGSRGATGVLTPPPLHRSQRSTFLLTNNLKQSDLIIFFESYSLENSERVNKPHAFRKTCFHLYVSALKRGVWYAYKAFTPC